MKYIKIIAILLIVPKVINQEKMMDQYTVWLDAPLWLAGICGDCFVCSEVTLEHAEARAQTALQQFTARWKGVEAAVLVLREPDQEMVYYLSTGAGA